jgi:cystathionine beta-lyase
MNVSEATPLDPHTGALSIPIYQTSTFEWSELESPRDFEYSRSGNPTRKAFEELIATLESGDHGFAMSSGMAAIDLVLRLLRPGDEIISIPNIYGGTHRLLNQVYNNYGIKHTTIDLSHPAGQLEALRVKPKMVWIESPTNPLLNVYDIKEICEVFRDLNTIVVVDSTFCTPYLQKPIELGADIVVHSVTKYIGGHSDLIAGAVVSKGKDLGDRLAFLQNAIGAILGPQDSWLAIRGAQTIDLRMIRICASALSIARKLEEHPYVKKVFYPGLKSHPNHDLALRQQGGYCGGMISFELVQEEAEIIATFFNNLKYHRLAESLGGTKSLICHPATMTHKCISAEERKRAGISNGLIRISVGLERETSLWNDLNNALNAVGTILNIIEHEKAFAFG